MKHLLIILLFLFFGCAQPLVFVRKQYNSSYQPNYTTSYNSANIKMEVLEAKNDDNINKIIYKLPYVISFDLAFTHCQIVDLFF